MATYPTASVVSRVLRRDVKIITRPFPKTGYSVHGGDRSYAPGIWVNISDSESRNQRAARELAENLHEVFGWQCLRTEGSSIIYVHDVPSAVQAREAEARYDAQEAAATQRRIAAAELK